MLTLAYFNTMSSFLFQSTYRHPCVSKKKKKKRHLSFSKGSRLKAYANLPKQIGLLITILVYFRQMFP